MRSTSTNYWWFFAVLAAVSLVGLIRLAVVGEPGDPEVRTQMLSAAVITLAFGAMTVIALSAGRRTGALDRAGPVAAAQTSEVTGAETGGRWSIDQVAAQLARELAPMNAVVFREGASRRLRIMLDPASAILEHRPAGRPPSESGTLRGQWWEVTWRHRRAPRIRRRSTAVGVRLDAEGRALPRWQRGADTRGPIADRMALESAQRIPAELEISTAELVRVADEIAVRSGWASQAQVGSVTRSLPETTRTVSRRGSGEGRTEAHVRTTHGRPGAPPGEGTTTIRSSETTTTSSGTSSTSWSTGSTTRTTSASFDSSSDAARSAFPPPSPFGDEPPVGPNEPPVGPNGPPIGPRSGLPRPPGFAGVGRAMRWVGIAVLAACVLATAIGLLAGMVWWASFIIIGSGLLFCLLFVLPWVLLGRSSAERS